MIQEFLKLFPNAYLVSNQEDIHSNPTITLIPYDNQFIALPTDQLSEREQSLLNLFYNEQFEQFSYHMDSEWALFLHNHSHQMPPFTGTVQFLYLFFKQTPNDFQLPLWLSTFQESFSAIISWFAPDAKTAIIILDRQQLDTETFERIQTIILMLDNDFDTRTYFVTGYTYPMSYDLIERYTHELKVVQLSFQSDIAASHHTLTPLLLRTVAHHAQAQLPILQPIHQLILSNSEYSQLIQTLFENQGNLSQTAEKLYIHRNTLTYRIHKFYKETGLQLQFLPDLFICYLCLG